MRRYSPTSPRVVLPLLLVLLVLAALLQPAPDSSDPRLSSYSAAPDGGKALMDVARALGWRPSRRTTPLEGTLDSAATYAVLAPAVPLSAAEAHALLDAVRRGAGLLLAVPEGGAADALADSLHLATQGLGFHPIAGGSAEHVGGRAGTAGACTIAPGAGNTYVGRVFARRVPLPEDSTTLVAAQYGGEARPVAFSRTLGRGRVVAVAEPDLLRNDVLRLCGSEVAPQRPGVRAVRLLEAAAPAGGPLVFDEFHQGYGVQPDREDAVTYALLRTPWGRAVGAAVLAALLALWSAGARALVPVERGTVERRSPLEHVGALARAYEQVGASRTAARRLVRGLRRRHPAAARRGADDDAFLDGVAVANPRLAPAVALVREATTRQLPPSELPRLGAAVDEIDRALARPGAGR